MTGARKAPCFVVGKEKYSIPDNVKIVFLKFPVFLNILSTVTSSQPSCKNKKGVPL